MTRQFARTLHHFLAEPVPEIVVSGISLETLCSSSPAETPLDDGEFIGAGP
jgi:hypothetical protein